mgnify:CR=1 FL=1
MNQILITEKLYITPELKRQKKLYKIDFIISVFLLCLLCSYYIYAEYDKYSGEKKSQEILANMEIPDSIQSTYVYDDTTVKVEDNEKIVVILNDEDSASLIDTSNLSSSSKYSSTKVTPKNVMKTDSGEEYYAIATINIPKLEWDEPYPILDHWSNDLLKISPCKFHGADPNEVGNFCIVGHNYRNSLFFSKVPTLENGDSIEITDNYGRKINYIVYDKHVVNEDNTKDTSQVTHGKKEITIITCTNDSKNRVIVKAREEGK